MKIAVLVYSLHGIGGIAKHALYLSRELAAMGHQVAVWSVEYDRDRCYPELAEGLDVKMLRSARPPKSDSAQKPPGTRMMANLWALWRYGQDQHRLCSAMPGGYDVVNAHGNLISWAAAAYKRQYGTPVVWMCNDFVPIASHRYEVVSDIWQNAKHTVKTGLCFPFAQYDRTAVREIDTVAVLSEQVRVQMMRHYGVEPVTVRKGVDSARFARGDGRQTRARYHIPDDSFLLLTVCSLMPRRRLEDVVRAVRILVDEGLNMTYLVVGRKSHVLAYSESMETEVSACNLGDRVIFAGEAPEQELVNCYHACDAFVWAADERQSWSSAGMEAMAAGKPVIASTANGLAEILKDGETALLVMPRNPRAIADAVKRLIVDPVLARSLASRGQRLMQEKYSWCRYARTMLALFQEAMREP